MKNSILFISLLSSSIFILSCDKNEDEIIEEMHTETSFDYHAHIHSPNSNDKHIGDTIHIHIEFESHTGETIHHAQVLVLKEGDNSEIYNMPSDIHVHETSGVYEFHDDLVLSEENGFDQHGDYIIQSKVWGHEVGMQEEVETIQFHVHP